MEIKIIHSSYGCWSYFLAIYHSCLCCCHLVLLLQLSGKTPILIEINLHLPHCLFQSSWTWKCWRKSMNDMNHYTFMISKHPGQLAIPCCVMIIPELFFFLFCHFQHLSLFDTSKREKEPIWWKVPQFMIPNLPALLHARPYSSVSSYYSGESSFLIPKVHQLLVFFKDLTWSFNLFISCILKPYLYI